LLRVSLANGLALEELKIIRLDERHAIDTTNQHTRFQGDSVSIANPTFSDIMTLLNTLFNKDPNIGDSPHGIFWQNTTRDAFVKIRTDPWGATGPLVALGDPNGSNLYLALAGLAPFDGSEIEQMPDTGADPNARHATSDELQTVATWITNNAPA
jgi:hypothetical protein